MKRLSYRDQDRVFGQLMLTLRTAIGLTQAGLADLLGVSRHAVGGWEAGQTYPKPNHLKLLIELGVAQHAFASGREIEEIRALWQAARQKVLLDERWLRELVSEQASPPVLFERAHGTDAASAPSAERAPQVDWGEALDVPRFYGRATELALLAQWIGDDHCRVVSVLGMGGIGKSALAVTAMRQVATQFEVVIWRSLRDAPACEALLETYLRVLAPQSLPNLPDSFDGRLQLLMEQLREQRVLLVLDNLEVLLEDTGTGRMREGAEGYARLLQRIGETTHRSCLLLTSREKPADLVPLEGNRSPVRAVRLAGLDLAAGEQLLIEKGVVSPLQDRSRLVELYQGNPLALKIVAQTIVDLFGGEIASFLAQGEMVFGGVRELLDEQLDRLSALDQTVVYWLAILREPASLEELLAAFSTPRARMPVLEALEGLRRRGLLEHGQRAGSFTLQSVVLEYVTAQLIAEAGSEIEQGNLAQLIAYGFCQAHAKEYVRKTQQQLLIAPLLTRLQRTYPGQAGVEARLRELLDLLREWDRDAQGYGPANLFALLHVLRGDVRGLNFARLFLRGVSLQGVEMQDARLSGAMLQDSAFTEAFEAIRMVAISKDGRRWVAGSRRGEVRVWGDTGKTLDRVWQAHLSDMTALALSPDGRTLASVSFDTTIKLWNVERGALLWAAGQPGAINAVAFAPDGQLLASGGNDGRVHVWDAQSGAEVLTLADQGAMISSLAWSADAQLLASGCANGSIWLWNMSAAAPGSQPRKLAGHRHWVSGLAFAPDGPLLASAGFDGTVKLWDTVRGSLLQTASQHSAAVLRVVWSPDGRTLASCNFDHSIGLWDVTEARPQTTLYGHTGVIHGLAFAPDSRSLLSASDDGTIRVWDVARGQSLHILGGYVATLLDVDWSPDGMRLAAAGADTVVTIWDSAGATPPRILRGHRWIVQGVAWSPDGQLLASGGYDNSLGLWDTATGVRLRELRDSDATDTLILGVAWSPDGRLLACGSYQRGVHVWDTATYTRRWVGHTVPTLIRRVAWNPAATQLAGAGGDGYVYVWDASAGRLLQQLAGQDGAIVGVAWSPDGARLAAGGASRAGAELFVWDAAAGRRLQTIGGHPGLVTAIAWSAGGDVLISGGSDGMLRWWDIESGQCLQVRQGHAGNVQALKRSPDQTKLASCGDDGAIVLWDIRSGERLQTLRRDRPYERMDITDLTGITDAQRASLIALGAVERPAERAILLRPSPRADADQSQQRGHQLTSSLPVPATSFIGRDQELSAIAKVLAEPSCRLLTLIGPGGIGKSRLALAAAAAQTASFADGVVFVALAAVDTPRQLVSAIGDSLGLAFAEHPDPTAHLLSELRERHMLLVLDNFEQLLDGADLVADMLASAPRVSLIVTSRERLNLRAEWLFDVDGLAYPLEDPRGSASAQSQTQLAGYSAVQLFVQRATQVQPALMLDEAALLAIAHICQHVAGMPLAIELAAAGARTLPLAEIEWQIRTNLDALATTMRDVPARHRSLRAVFDHSWKLLDTTERVLLSRLAVFRGGWTIAAAAAVQSSEFKAQNSESQSAQLLTPNSELLTVLTALVEKSLVRPNSGTNQPFVMDTVPDAPEPRFTLLEPIREFALEQLVARGEAQAIQHTHANYYQALVLSVTEQWRSSTFAMAIALLQREHDNIRAALAWARDSGENLLGLRLAVSLWHFWWSYGYISEGRAWLEQLLAINVSNPDPTLVAVRQRALYEAAWLASDQHDYVQAAHLFRQSKALRPDGGDTAGDDELLLNAARQARTEGNYRQATTLLEQGLARHRALGLDTARGNVIEQPELYAFGRLLRETGLVTREQGNFARATALFEEYLAYHRAVGDRACVAFALLGLADVARDQGDSEQVRVHGEAALAILRELGMQWAIGFTLNTLALGAYYAGDLARALALIRESEALFRHLNAGGSLAEILITVGKIERAREAMETASSALAEALRLAQASGPRVFVAACMEELAGLAAFQGQTNQAAQLLAVASALREHMGAPVWPANQAAVNTALATTRAILGEDAVAATWARAHALPLEALLSTIPGMVDATMADAP